jgi:hypothetical protein
MTDHKQRHANAMGVKLGPAKGKWKAKPFPFPPPLPTQFPRPAHDTTFPAKLIPTHASRIHPAPHLQSTVQYCLAPIAAHPAAIPNASPLCE